MVRSRYIVITTGKKGLVCYKRPIGSSSLELELGKVSSCAAGLLNSTPDFLGAFDVVFVGLGLGFEVPVLLVACFFAFGL